MRVPVLTNTQSPMRDPDLVEALSDAVAQVLIAEFRLRRSQHNQQDPAATAMPRRGPNHTDHDGDGEL